MLTDVHRITPRARVSLPRTRPRQQTRAYRFGMWSSYLDPEFHRDLHRHQRMMKHKLSETLTRKLSWDRHPFAQDPKDAMKRILERHSVYGTSHRSRFISLGSPFDCNSSFTQSDANNGDTRDTSQQFPWFSNSVKPRYHGVLHQWTEQIVKGARQAKSNSVSSKAQEKADARSEFSEQTTAKEAQEDDYVIDPITNRKIPRNVYGTRDAQPGTPAPTFKTYRSQFSAFAPPEPEAARPVVHSNGPPPADELKKYAQVHIDSNPSGASSSTQNATAAAPEELKDYENPAIHREEYSLNHLPPDKPNETYDDLHKYKPYMYDEPNRSVEQEAPKHDHFYKYKPYMPNEGAVTEDGTNKYGDLDKYGPYMYKEDTKADDSSPKYKDLDKYDGPFMYNEGVKAEEPVKDPELEKYGPFMHREGISAEESTPKYDDLHKYHPKEFQDASSGVNDQPFAQYGDLDQYKMYRYQEPDGKPAAEKDIVAECLKEYDAKMEMSGSKDAKPSIAERLSKLDLSEAESQVRLEQPLKTSISTSETKSQDDSELAMENHSEASDAAVCEAYASIQESGARVEDENIANSKSTTTENPVGRLPRIRFPAESPLFQPESVAAEGLDTASSDNSANASRLETALDRQNKGISDGGRISLKARAEAEAEADPYSKEPQGLETSYAEECGDKPTWPTFVKTYSSIADTDTQETKAASTRTAGEETAEVAYQRDPEIDGLPQKETAAGDTAMPERDPTIYKILAYDPTTQNISTAETTSVVPDDATPLTPADVLLRLKNPTRFLPHFAPLQAEGFEIVSGGGDVLVFRKVRDAGKSRQQQQQQQPPVNPIDMMGRPTPLPSAAAFASPTGFVNYDLPPAVEESATTPTTPTSATTNAATTAASPLRAFSSSSGNIQDHVVRREEPVFSGRKSSSSSSSSSSAAQEQEAAAAAPRTKTDKEGKKKQEESIGVGKRMLVAGAWVAGISYTLGVVGDYFITGGVDGKGPTGL